MKDQGFISGSRRVELKSSDGFGFVCVFVGFFFTHGPGWAYTLITKRAELQREISFSLFELESELIFFK